MKVIWIPVALAMFTSGAWAQSQGEVPFGFAMDGPSGGGTTSLLQMPDVHNHLELASSQKAQIAEVLRSARIERRTLLEKIFDGQIFDKPVTHAELKSILRALNRETEKRLETEVLNERQVNRLNQLHLQLEGISAVYRPQVAEALGLSEDQQQQLAELRNQTTPEFGVTSVADADRLLSPVLDRGQQDRLSEMHGDSFSFEVLRRYAEQSRSAWQKREVLKRENVQLVFLR